MDKTRYRLMIEQETPEQRAKRLEYCREKAKEYRLRKGTMPAKQRFFSKMTEEEKRRYGGDVSKKYRATRKAKETPEQKEHRMQISRASGKRAYAKLCADPAKYAERAAKQKAYREKRKEGK
jgi:hypothetical protein